MIKTIFTPHPLLQPYFELYFTIQTPKSTEGFREARELVIPDGTHGILFMQEESIKRYDAIDQQKRQDLRNSYVFGQKSRSVYYHLKANGSNCIGIKLHPNGLSAFTRETMHGLTDDLVVAEAIFGKLFKELEEQIFHARTDAAKVQAINQWFIKQLPVQKSIDHLLVTNILAFIHQQRGQIQIQTILSKYNIGYKRVERLFKRKIGLTPKAYCRLIRFNASLYYHHQPTLENLTQLAYATGHFDQMHFIKEIKQFTNLRPKVFFANDIQVVANYQKKLINRRLN